MQLDDYRFYVSFPPHILGKKSVSGIIHNNLIALIPAILAALYYFRVDALKVMVLATITALLCEAGMQKFLKRDITITDGHAILIGLLFAFLLSPAVPWWVVVIGAASSIIVGKLIFGEMGNNPFNSVLVGWVMIRLSWPEKLNNWIEPFGGGIPDPPLQVFKFDGIDSFIDYDFRLLDLFLGQQAGGIGTICTVALLAGGIYLLSKRIMSSSAQPGRPNPTSPARPPGSLRLQHKHSRPWPGPANSNTSPRQTRSSRPGRFACGRVRRESDPISERRRNLCRSLLSGRGVPSKRALLPQPGASATRTNRPGISAAPRPPVRGKANDGAEMKRECL